MRFSNAIEISRPPQAVFEYLVTPENIPTWNPAIAEAKRLTPGSPQVGTRIRQRRTRPRPTWEELEVTELVEGHRMVLAGDLGPLNGTLSYELEPTASGTLLTNTADLNATGALALVAPLATGRIRASVAENLVTLKHVLEDGGS